MFGGGEGQQVCGWVAFAFVDLRAQDLVVEVEERHLILDNGLPRAVVEGRDVDLGRFG
jgi:hypothetical protein